MSEPSASALSTLEYHVLLSMAAGPQYGYAVKSAVEEESTGTLTPRAGTLYRVLARLMSARLVEEAHPGKAETHPGRARRYYALTAEGRHALASEADRLKDAAALAEARLGMARGRS